MWLTPEIFMRRRQQDSIFLKFMGLGQRNEFVLSPENVDYSMLKTSAFKERTVSWLGDLSL